MRSALSLIAVFAGLCAAGTAAPLSQETFFYQDPLESAPRLWGDLSIPSVLQSLKKLDTPPGPGGQSPVIFDEMTGIPEGAASIALDVHEPGTLVSAACGLALLAALGIYRLNYAEIRRHRDACAFTA